MPTVEVVIPCFNAAPYVGRTLESLLHQTLDDWECIVVDDGSTDASATVVESYATADSRIVLLRQPNGGVSRARNMGYAACSSTSTYLLFLDADDCLEPTMLEVMVDYLDRREDVGIAYCRFVCVDQDDRLIADADPRAMHIVRYVPTRWGIQALPPTVPDTPFLSIFSMWAGLLPSNSVLRRSVYAATPGWDESLGRPAEDTDVHLQMALRSGVHYLPEPLVRYRRHSAQFTNDWTTGAGRERKLYRKWRHIGGLTPRQRALVADARRFRDSRLMPYLWSKWGIAHLRSGHVVEGAKCYVRAAKQLVGF